LTESGTIRFNQFATYLLTTSSGAGAPVLAVGDEYIGGLKYTTRGLLTFSLQSVPQMETLISAELTLPPAQILGDPFASLGNLVVEQVELDDTLMAEEAYLSPGTTIVPDFLLDEGEINITSEIRTAVGAGDRRIRFRFRFDQETMDGDAFADQYVLPTGSTPTIIIRYYPAAGN